MASLLSCSDPSRLLKIQGHRVKAGKVLRLTNTAVMQGTQSAADTCGRLMP